MTLDEAIAIILELRAEAARLSGLLRAYGYVEPQPVDAPSDKQVDTLITLVTSKYPQLRGIDKQQFERALAFFARVHRPDKVNRTYHLSFWKDFCRTEYLSKQALPPEMSDASFVAAAIVSGIKYEPLDPRSVSAVNLALSMSFAQPSNAWRHTLEHGVPDPVEPYRPPPRPTQTNLILGLNR